MRHAVFGRKLSRDTNARQALLNNLASVLLERGQITTTVAKAKFTRAHVEKLITKAKRNSLVTRRIIASQITGGAFKRLITEVGPGFVNRPGGYTRILRLSSRKGDAVPMAKIELLKMDKKAIAESTVPSLIKKQSAQIEKS